MRLLAEHVLNMNKFELVINHIREISKEKEYEFFSGLKKLKNNIPIQYITNHQEFMKLDFYVDENVLIPQPDTEVLVEEVIKYVEKNSEKLSNTLPIKILDLCTGSGAIAISLAKYIDNCEVIATDISSKAIQIAKLNAEKNMVHEKITFIESDMFNSIPETKFDIIVSNPPYIESAVIPTLSKEVQKEPIIALDGGKDGLDFYKNIIDNLTKYSKSNSLLFLEIGYNQKDKLFNLIKTTIPSSNPKCIQDLANNDRVIILELNY